MRNLRCLIFLLVFWQRLAIAEDVLIITSAYNRPDFIEIQDRCLRKFLKDTYRFVVFNDAASPSMRSRIEAMCVKLSIECVNIPQEIHDRPYLPREPGENYHDPAVRNANVVQYALNMIGFDHDGIVAILDSDMFLVKNFSIADFLRNYDMAGLHQSTAKDINYIWIGIAFLNMKKLPNKERISFNCGKIRGIPVDAGGYTHVYLEEHPSVLVKYFDSILSPFIRCQTCKIKNHYPCPHSSDLLNLYGFDENQIEFILKGPPHIQFLISGNFFHYRCGTNWDYRTTQFHANKTDLCNKYLEKILSE